MECKILEEYPMYLIYKDGRIFSMYWKRFLSYTLDKDGYEKVTLINKNNEIKYLRVHRVIAETFIPNPKKLPLVNHKDENKRNNNVSNLEWCDSKYNANYGTRNKKLRDCFRKQIKQFDLEGNYIKTWDAISDAMKFYNNSGIWLCVAGKRKTAAGYKWSY